MFRLALIALCLLVLAPCVIAQPRQGKAKLDSLLAELPRMNADTNKVTLLKDISNLCYGISPLDGIYYGEQGIILARKLGWQKGEADAANAVGVNLSKSDHAKALEYHLRALKIYESLHVKIGIANASQNIGNIHYYLNSYQKAQEYYLKALKLFEDLSNTRGIAKNAINVGITYAKKKDFDKALQYYAAALRAGEETGEKSTIASAARNSGEVYFDKGDYPKAIEYYSTAQKISADLGDKAGIADATLGIGRAYLKQGKLAEAQQLITSALRTGSDLGQLGLIKSANENLSKLYEKSSDSQKALAYYKDYIKFKDSLSNDEVKRKTLALEMNYEFSKKADSLKAASEQEQLRLQKEKALADLRFEYERKQASAKTDGERRKYAQEAELKRRQLIDKYNFTLAHQEAERQKGVALAKAESDRKAALATAELKRQETLETAAISCGTLLLLLAGIALIAYRNKNKRAAIIQEEKERAEGLLHNILPAAVAKEIKEKGEAEARQFEEVSVLFAELIDIAGVLDSRTPQSMVQELHDCFSAFDSIVEREGLEKIKTNGRVFMAVCGLPVSDRRHAQKTIAAAIAIAGFTEQRRKEKNGAGLAVKIGVNSGPVVAGIVGIMKYAYDIWGDTVNTAARMQQHGESGKVNISRTTYELIKADYPCVYRGKIPAKNKGEVEMYFVEVATSIHEAI
jgi:class 3 adenylate cyclase/tetratricopeptide (TPR) repeat protein